MSWGLDGIKHSCTVLNIIPGKFSVNESHLCCYPTYFLPWIIFKLFFSSCGGSKSLRNGKHDFWHMKKVRLISWRCCAYSFCLSMFVASVRMSLSLKAPKRNKTISRGFLYWGFDTGCFLTLFWGSPPIGNTGLNIYSGRIPESDSWMFGSESQEQGSGRRPLFRNLSVNDKPSLWLSVHRECV